MLSMEIHHLIKCHTVSSLLGLIILIHISKTFNHLHAYLLLSSLILKSFFGCKDQNWIQKMAPHSSTLAGESHGWRSLVGCSPWGREELDTTERLPFHFSLSCIGEGNGNPLQCSCLENPRDWGAWWAAIYGVAQSQTRLKWLSCSSTNTCSDQEER